MEITSAAIVGVAVLGLVCVIPILSGINDFIDPKTNFTLKTIVTLLWVLFSVTICWMGQRRYQEAERRAEERHQEAEKRYEEAERRHQEGIKRHQEAEKRSEENFDQLHYMVEKRNRKLSELLAENFRLAGLLNKQGEIKGGKPTIEEKHDLPYIVERVYLKGDSGGNIVDFHLNYFSDGSIVGYYNQHGDKFGLSGRLEKNGDRMVLVEEKNGVHTANIVLEKKKEGMLRKKETWFGDLVNITGDLMTYKVHLHRES